MLAHRTEWSIAVVIVIEIYFVGLVALGAYTLRPRHMTLSSVLDIGAVPMNGWGVSFAVTYLMSPSDLAPHSPRRE